MSLPKITKLLTTLLFYCFIVSLFSNSVHALDKSGKHLGTKSLKEFQKTVSKGQVNKETWNYTMVDDIINTLTTISAGEVEGVTTSVSRPGGAIGSVAGMIGSMYANPPANTTEYLADLGSSLGIVRPAYAQGTGWQALTPILKIWKAFRNVSYMGFVIIFIAIGFMIMFRAKINPQTVITLQSALPKLVITLLLITFSYAIAGLMIDLIYISIYLIVGVFNLGGLITNSSDVITKLLTKNPFSLTYPVKPGLGGAEDLFTSGPADALQEIIQGLFGAWQPEGGNLLGQSVGALAKCILAIAVLFSVFKLFFALLMSYLGIIISVIFAPFTLLMNALPGSNSFSNWMKGLLANIAPFPVVAGMFLLAAVLIGPKGDNNPWSVADDTGFYSEQSGQKEVWVPPMLTLGNEGGAGSVNAFQGLIALGMIMMMPTVVGKIKKMLKVEPSGFGGAIAGGLLSPISAVGQFGQQVYGGYQQISSMQTAKAQKKWFTREGSQKTGGGSQ